MRINWYELTPRQKDALIAEHIYGLDPLLGRHGLHENGDIEYSMGYPHGHDTALNYSTDASAADVMEDEIDRQGLEDRYLVNLAAIYGNVRIVALHYATADQRCLAALRAKGVEV